MRALDLSRFKNATHLASGRHASLFSGNGVEFAGLREYAWGDSRRIDWKSSLRSSKVLERSYVPDREIPVWFVLDVSASMGYGTPGFRPMDTALAAFDLVAAGARRSGNPFAAVAFADTPVLRLPPGRSLSSVAAFRRSLTTLLENSQPAFSEALPVSELRLRIRSKSVVVFVSDRIFEFPPEFGASLRRSHAFFLHVRSPLESEPPITDVATFGNGNGTFLSPASFRGAEANPESEPRSFDCGIPALSIPSGLDPYPALERLLSR